MHTGYRQDVANLISLGAARLNRIPPVRQPYHSIGTKFDNDEHSLVAPVNMRRPVILRIRSKCDAIEPVRARAVEYAESDEL